MAVEAAGIGPWDRLLNAGWDVGLRPRRRWEWRARARCWPSARVSPGLPQAIGCSQHEAPLPGGSGFWAERVLINADHAASCPPGLDAVHAAALRVNGLTALQALEKLDLS